jgi:heparanase
MLTNCGRFGRRAGLGLGIILLGSNLVAAAAEVEVAPHALPAIGKVDERFQSYNVEMAEVIGGRFWAPYPKSGEPPAKPGDPAATMFRKRDPLDLRHNMRLRTLAAALGPAYVRVSGAWANSLYFQDDDTAPAEKAPAGYKGLLTRPEWAGVVDFAKAANARIVASFSVAAADRGPDGVWKPDQARALVHFTRSLGGEIYAAELVNEPNVGALVDLPKSYDAAMFARDQAVFRDFAATDAPDLKIVGPGSTGEAGYQLFPVSTANLSTEALMTAEPRSRFDIFSYHAYGALSQRCALLGPNLGIPADQALSEAWLDRTDKVLAYYKSYHDRFAPDAPIWVTEAAEASCGGDAWAATFLDTFRYVDQMGRLAKQGVQAIFHNTLAASDYALIDDTTWAPRPSYWAALLWRQLMGETVLDAGPLTPGLHVYAQCLRGRSGGVGMVAINLDPKAPKSIRTAAAAEAYTLTADDLQSGAVKLNGQALQLVANDHLPALRSVHVAAGHASLAPASISFLAFPKADNPACRL